MFGYLEINTNASPNRVHDEGELSSPRAGSKDVRSRDQKLRTTENHQDGRADDIWIASLICLAAGEGRLCHANPESLSACCHAFALNLFVQSRGCFELLVTLAVVRLTPKLGRRSAVERSGSDARLSCLSVRHIRQTPLG